MAVPAAPWKVLPQGRLVPEQRSQPQVEKRETEEGKKKKKKGNLFEKAQQKLWKVAPSA